MQVNWSFNANQFEPNQGLGIHPPANKIPFQITGTNIRETKDKDGHYLEIEFSSPLGVVIARYNINNKNPKAVEIAYGQLSALCRATNIYNINGNNECSELRGARGLMDVGYQKGEEPSADNPNAKGYTELKRVYDMAGNEPGKPPAQPQPQTAQPQGQPAPMVAQSGGGWGAGAGQANPSQQAPNPSWGGNPNAAQQQPQSQPQTQTGQAWQPNSGAAPAATPPWGNR